MKQILSKVLRMEIDKRLLAFLMTLVLLIVIAPIARIMMYCVPWYDDFSYGRWVKIALEENGSFWSALRGAAESAKSSYYAWQGTFSSCFMMSLMPAAWGSDKYVFGLWFILLLFLTGIYAVVSVLLREVLRADRFSTLAVQAIIAATCVLLFRSPIEGLFWYNSGVHYTAMHSFGLLLIAALIKAVYTEKKVLRGVLVFLSIPLAFFVGGAAMAAAVYISTTAPGNDKRMVHFTGMSTSPMEAVLNSFKSAFTYFDDFTGWMMFAILIMMLPIVIKIVTNTKFTFRYPGLVALWSFCLYATGFTPTLFTMGHTLLGRATNMAKVTFQLLMFLNLFYMAGWICRYLSQKKQKQITGRNSICFYILMAFIMFGIFVAEPNKGGQYTTYVAYYFVHTGEAYNYHQEYLNRVKICEGEEMDVVVRPYVFKPWVLCLGDLSADSEYEPNRFMASYFGKNSITCLTREEEQAIQQ